MNRKTSERPAGRNAPLPAREARMGAIFWRQRGTDKVVKSGTPQNILKSLAVR